MGRDTRVSGRGGRQLGDKRARRDETGMGNYKSGGTIVSDTHAEEIYAALRRRMNPKTHNLFPRWHVIAKELGLSKSTVIRNARHLFETGRIRSDFIPANNPQLPEECGFEVITIL